MFSQTFSRSPFWLTPEVNFGENFLENWTQLTPRRKPVTGDWRMEWLEWWAGEPPAWPKRTFAQTHFRPAPLPVYVYVYVYVCVRYPGSVWKCLNVSDWQRMCALRFYCLWFDVYNSKGCDWYGSRRLPGHLSPGRVSEAKAVEAEAETETAAEASDFNKFDGFPFATQTQSSIRSKKFRITQDECGGQGCRLAGWVKLGEALKWLIQAKLLTWQRDCANEGNTLCVKFPIELKCTWTNGDILRGIKNTINDLTNILTINYLEKFKIRELDTWVRTFVSKGELNNIMLFYSEFHSV